MTMRHQPIPVDPTAMDITATLNELITICHDGYEGYKAAAEAAESENNRVMFQAHAAQRQTFAKRLTHYVLQHGGEPAEESHVAGELHQAWIGLRAALSNGDSAILAECARGDSYAIEKYDEALSYTLPEDVRETVARQLSELRAAHKKMENLADLTS